MDPHLRELLDLLVRWVHMIAGIMWIGNSMLFNWLDRVLRRPEDADKNLVGRMWMVHSGGFYDVKKLHLEPKELPEELHWFKWQNFTTWASGMLMLGIVYYMGGAAFMVDANVANISHGLAVAIGLGTILVAWVLYDLLWRSPLGKKTPVAAAISFALLAGVILLLTHTLSGRAAFIHLGVLLGTIMTGNVWMHIMPSQKELVAATTEGRDQDPAIGYRAKQRSIHNNYMTFPVLFTMISNHFPSTYGHELNWLVLAMLVVSSAGVRHFMNIRYHVSTRGWAPPLTATAAAGVVALAFFMFKPAAPASTVAYDHPVTFTEVQSVIAQRCATCHSASPSDAMFGSAPAGLALDTPEQIGASAQRIHTVTVSTKTMPLGNKTGMTDEERALVGAWVKQGAPLN